MRVAARAGATEEAAIQFDSRLKRMLRHPQRRFAIRLREREPDAWRPVLADFLDLVSLPA